jgi:hypothetical protein
MKFRYLITLLSIFIFSIAESQIVQLSTTNINQGGFDYASTLGEMNEGYIVLQSNLPIGTEKERVGLKSRKQQLSLFDEKLNKKWQLPVLPTLAGASVEGIIMFQNNILVFYSSYSKENNRLEIYFDSYNSLGKLIESKRKLGETTITKYNDLEKIRILISPDKESLGIYINEADDDNQNIHLITYSTQENTSNKDFKIKYGNELLYLNNFLLDNNGNLYVSGQLKNKENKKQKSQYLFCYISSINSLIEKVVSDFNTPISDVIIKFNPIKNEIICGGISVDNNSYSGSSIKLLIADSIFNFRELNYSIQGSSLKDLIGERNSSGISLDNYTMQDLILREDGGALLVAEAQYLSEYSFYDQFTQTFNRRTEYHFDNIVLFSVSPNEKIDWCKVIKKEQVSMDDFGIFSSFASYVNNDEIGFIYNKDSGRNFELMNVIITKDGELTSKRINKSNIDAIIPRYSKQTDASIVCVPVLIKRQLYLAKIEFE